MPSRIKLIHGDCLEVLPTLPAGSVNMVLCDLPYGITACEWDKVISMELLWIEYKRLLTPNGVVVLFGSQPFTSYLVTSNLKDFKHEWIWRKPQGTNPFMARKAPMKNHESILVFGNKITYNPQMVSGKPYGGFESSDKRIGQIYGASKSVHTPNKGIRFPKSVIDFPQVRTGSLHPTQKPIPLLEYLVLTYSNAGDTVLDNCMGSGSTGVACKNLKRNFIGIEISEEYYKICVKRLHN